MRKLSSIALAACLVCLVGCGGDGLDRQAIRGTVSFRGAPLPEGSILFVPLATGPTSGATISDGRYAIAAADGLPPGQYRVEIIAYQPTGKTQPDSDNPGQTIETRAQVIPPEYNTRSTQTVEVVVGENRFELAIP